MHEFRIGNDATEEEAQALILEHVNGHPTITATLFVDTNGEADILCQIAPTLRNQPPANQAVLLTALAHRITAAIASTMLANNLADRKTVKHLKHVFDSLEHVSDKLGKHIQ